MSVGPIHEMGDAMTRRESDETKGSALSKRDRFWLRHMETLAAQGGPATAYAEKHGLSIGALYEARRRLVARRVPTLRVPRPKRTPLFARVTLPLSPPAPRDSGELRLRLASGTVLEWSTPPSIETLASLLDRIASLR